MLLLWSVQLWALSPINYTEYSKRKIELTNLEESPNLFNTTSGCLQFDGVDDYVETGIQVPANNQFTIEGWIMPGDKTFGHSDIQRFFSNFSGVGALNQGEFVVDNYPSSNNSIRVVLQESTGTRTVQLYNMYNLNEWFHLAVSYDNGIIKVYVNGLLKATNTSGTGNFYNATAPNIKLGRDISNPYAVAFFGNMDEVRFWTDIRTDSEISNKLYSTLLGTEQDLDVYYNFEDGTGTNLTDVASSKHGTLQNFDFNQAWLNTCQSGSPLLANQTITDTRDGTVYSTVEIGSQIWMAENLRYNLPNSPTIIDAQGSRLYTWNQAIGYNISDQDPLNNKGVCPCGWHLPTDEEWQDLEEYLGMPTAELSSGGFRGVIQEVGKKIKSINPIWPNNPGSNTSSFNAKPVGYVSPGATNISWGGWMTHYWTSTPNSANPTSSAIVRHISPNSQGVQRSGGNKQYRFSVRCIKNKIFQALSINPLKNDSECSLNNGSVLLDFNGGDPSIMPTVVWSDIGVGSLSRGNLSPGEYTCTVTRGTGISKTISFEILRLPCNNYTSLKYQLDNSYKELSNNQLKFKFVQEYAVQVGETINCIIYNWDRSIKVQTSFPIDEGTNWIDIDVSILDPSTIYTLEFEANKGEVYKLKFKTKPTP